MLSSVRNACSSGAGAVFFSLGAGYAMYKINRNNQELEEDRENRRYKMDKSIFKGPTSNSEPLKKVEKKESK